jgi:hypothetical protein
MGQKLTGTGQNSPLSLHSLPSAPASISHYSDKISHCRLKIRARHAQDASVQMFSNCNLSRRRVVAQACRWALACGRRAAGGCAGMREGVRPGGRARARAGGRAHWRAAGRHGGGASASGQAGGGGGVDDGGG